MGMKSQSDIDYKVHPAHASDTVNLVNLKEENETRKM